MLGSDFWRFYTISCCFMSKHNVYNSESHLLRRSHSHTRHTLSWPGWNAPSNLEMSSEDDFSQSG